MTFRDRLNELIENKGISSYKIAKETGIPQTTLSNYRNKEAKPSMANVRTLASYLGVAVNWLLFGMGDKYEDGDTVLTVEESNDFADVRESGTQMIPHIIEECADCGKPNGFGIAILENQCPKYAIPGLTGCDFTIPARGRSMINRRFPERSIKDGDIIGCRKWTSRSHIRWGEVYVLSTPTGITVKQLQPSDKEGHVKCVPFNTEEDFYPFDLPVDEIYDWAIVVGVVSVTIWS